MNSKNILGIIMGASFMGISMAIASYVLTGFGNSFLWQLGVVFFAVYGAVNGAIAGAVIIKYGLNFISGAVFGLLFNIAIGIAFLIFTMGNLVDETYYSWYASIIIGTFNGAIVSLVNKRQQQFK